MANYDLTNATPYNEQPLYRQGYADATDKACEWLAEHAKVFGCAEATDAWEATYKYDSELLVKQFKKAMEE